MKRNTCHQPKRQITMATYLMPIRNPLTRIQSWFQFEKDIVPIRRRNQQQQNHFRWKRGLLFVECYHNFVDLVVKGLHPLLAAPPTQLLGNDLYRNNDDTNTNASTSTTIPTSMVSAIHPVNMTCPERAWAAILGVREFSYHEWYNYEYYWTALLQQQQQEPVHPHLTASHNRRSFGLFDKDNKKNRTNGYIATPTLMVLRMEHLSTDWSQLSKETLFRPVNRGIRKELRIHHNTTRSHNQTFLSSSLTTTTSARNYTIFTSRRESEKILGQHESDIFWTNLCHAMCPEIQIYQQILYRSDNLQPFQIQQSIQELVELCPMMMMMMIQQERSENNHTTTTTCPGIPQFPLIPIPRRQYRTEIKKRLFTPI
jgi:hypothetical protein